MAEAQNTCVGQEPRGCHTCKQQGRSTLCHRAVQRTVPTGWTRIVSPRTGEVVILCPEHRWG